MKTSKIVVASLLLFSVFACNLQAGAPAPTVAAPNTLEPATPITPSGAATVAPTTAVPASSDHRIAVRVVDGVGEFYDRVSGDKFVPRGMNYVRIGPQTAPDGSTQTYHSTFDPDQYDGAGVEAALERMHADGYNVVRVFVSQNTIGTTDDGLSQPYMENVADFLSRANQNQIYVMLTQDWLPGGRYGKLINQGCCDQFNFNNAQSLPPTAVQAYQLYYADFITDLLNLKAPTDAIFSYELRNEYFYDTDYPPFKLNSGTVTAANGKTYDMSSAADKQKMAEENLPYFIDHVRTSILQSDPTALVSVGFFQPQSPNPTRIGDARLVVTAPAIWNSQADFIDLHAYPDAGLSLQQYVQNFGINGMESKPIIMGEFGGATANFASLDSAAHVFATWQSESCAYGFDGWLFWTWDTNEQPDFFNALQGSGQIEKALAPINRPDPCAP